ncbi:hypothetical protein PTKIN_Ptkin10aG0065000 [Pterospermum kingtungense]
MYVREQIWNTSILEELFDDNVVDAIMKVPFSHFNTKDKLIWGDSPIAEFFVKSTYNLARNIIGGILPAAKALLYKGVQVDMICRVCSDGEEDSYHLFFDFLVTKVV